VPNHGMMAIVSARISSIAADGGDVCRRRGVT
jgi:hypothetical protein